MFSPANKDGLLDTKRTVTQDNVEDIEDFGKENRPSKKGPKPVARSYEVNKKQSEREQEETHDVSLQNIDKNADYRGWLDMKKRKWKVTLETKKKRR